MKVGVCGCMVCMREITQAACMDVEKMQNGSEESGVKKKEVKMVKGRRKEGERNK
jgi:hypothetical protein